MDILNLTKLLKSKFLTGLLYGAFLIPMPSKNWLDLKYSKLPQNQVLMSKSIQIKVNSSASPLFYTFKVPINIDKLIVEGSAFVTKKIKKELDDSYFQIGVIYVGDYRPNSFIKMFLPEWMKILLKVGKDKGLSEIHFYGVSDKIDKKIKKQKVRDLKLVFQEISRIDEKGEFRLNMTLKNNKKVLGLWIRSDGDDSKAEFITTIKSIKVLKED